ncbi:DMT family transporter [uncultured Roseovarius sp.]|uniref:DMT family transporter n=1 Tax=uncultured Roseovarius sp. TaxID=293344 RepID=UPI00261F52CD|nr:DMT family transporter [uncultured Roseovarius sp.]
MHATARDGNRLGLAIATILFTTLALSLGDAAIKGQAAQFGLWQIFLLRSLLALPVFALLVAVFARGQSLWPKAPLWVALRVALLVGMWVAYYASLPHLQLSVAAAAYYTLPIFMTLFSAILLGDRIGVQGWAAVALGFAGVLIILRPGTEGVTLYVMLPLLSAVLYALAMILTHTKCREEHALVLALHLNVGFILTGGVASLVLFLSIADPQGGFLIRPWAVMSMDGWQVIGLLTLSILVGSIGAAIAYQNGPPAVIGIFDFAYVGFAVLWGVILFHEVPDIYSVIGIGAIVLAGLLAIGSRRG